MDERAEEPRDTGPWISFQLHLRADDPDVARKLARYARSQGDHDRGFDQSDRILRISDRFIDFGAFETVRECFNRINSTEEESDGWLQQLLDGDLGS